MKNNIIFIILVLLTLSGCVQNLPYHTTPWSEGNCRSDYVTKCLDSIYQEYDNYDLAFAEYSDRGNAFNRLWIDQILKKINERSYESGVVIITFVHGWRHNANNKDNNLVNFKESLSQIALDNEILQGRKLVGVYIGWRGSSLNMPLLDYSTFWDRKAVAEEVGKGGITELLLRLDQIDKINPNNVLVVIGHSFGGAIVVSGLAEVLTERILSQASLAKGIDSQSSITGVGDSIIVLNPTIEANQLLNLFETTLKYKYQIQQNPLFVSVSTNADWATHYAFPLGQSVDLLLTWRQTDLDRTNYVDRLTQKSLILKEEHLDATTSGNFAPFLTHWLIKEKKGLGLLKCDDVPDKCKPLGFSGLTGHPTFTPLPENFPLYFIKTDKTVMNSHGNIFNPVIKSFILDIISDVISRSIYSNKQLEEIPRPILRDKYELELN